MTAPDRKDIFDQTGVAHNGQFAICDKHDVVKQLKFDTSLQTTNTTTTLQAGSIASDVTITLPSTGGTLALTNGATSNSFTTIQPDHGTSPVAVTSTDTLTLTSSDGSVNITGNSTTDTIDFKFVDLSAITALTGDVTASGPGSVAAAVATVGGSSATNVHNAELLANAATSANTASAIVKRDGSGNFTAGTITAALTGTASGNTTYTAGNHGVVISGAGNAMTVIAPDASATKVLKSGGSSADPAWLAYDNANTASTLVFRDASNNFSAGTITAALTGNASTATTATTATNATNVATTSTSSNASFFPLFVASSSNSNQASSLGTGLTFNPSTNNLSTTTFTGALSGNATNITASSNATLTTISTLVSIGTITTGTWSATTIGTNKGGTGVTSVTTAPAASSFAGWDANKNLSANNHLEGYATTATAGGTTTLVVGDAYQQYFTGSSAQTVKLPVVSTLVLGQSYNIVNNSTGAVTVQSSGANTIVVMSGSSNAIFTVISTSGTGTSSWSFQNTQSSIQVVKATGTGVSIGTTGNYLATSASISLTAGSWELQGTFYIESGFVSVAASAGILTESGFYAADGANSSSQPTALTNTFGYTDYTNLGGTAVAVSLIGNGTQSVDILSSTLIAYITVTSTTSVFLVPRGYLNGVGAAGTIQPFLQARRLF